tara:strand:+ start:97 stop:669 length:573 start_codon:yes stop_codon:yes gene_type:complete
LNLFVLSECPQESARMMCDKHIPKMIVEAAQMLSTSHRMLDGYMEKRPSKSGKRMVKAYVHNNTDLDGVLYNAVHHYHPCTVWTMETKANYEWHYTHFLELCSEFVYRFGKEHLSYTKLHNILSVAPKNIRDIGLTEFPQAMNQFPECKVEGNPVQAYRNYYHFTKGFAKWAKGREAPFWWEGFKGELAL